jgi:hypothetical protein
MGQWNDRSLAGLVSEDRRFRDARAGADAYADAWALNYYLIKYEPKAYAEYLKHLSEKQPLIETSPSERLEEFQQHFGDLKELEQDFLRRMSRVE